MSDPDLRVAAPSKRPWLRVVLISLGACLALVVSGVVVLALLARKQLAAIEGHFEAVTRARAAPGLPVSDPMLPPGVVVVDLVGAAPEMRVRQPATLQAGTRVGAWAVGAPAQLDGMGGERACPISVSGPYLVEPVSFDAPAGAHGARLALRVLPIDPATPIEASPRMTPQMMLDVDLTRPDVVALRWRQGPTVVAMTDVERSPEALAVPALTARFQAEWTMHRGHFDAMDQKLDQSSVLVAPAATFAEVSPVVEALLATKRTMIQPGGTQDVAVFEVSVRPPYPPRPPAAPRPIDEGPPWKGPAPRVRADAPMLSGRLPPEVVERIIGAQEGEVRRCYVDGLRREPKLRGRVQLRLVVGRDGVVSRVSGDGSELPDEAAVACVARSFEVLSFPQPASGIVTVTQSYQLSTGAEHLTFPPAPPKRAVGVGPRRRPFRGCRQMSITTSPPGRAQQMSTLPSAGGSSGAGS